MSMLNSQLILNQSIVDDEWTFVPLPSGHEEIKKQAGKVVLFKLTGESLPSELQINETVIPQTGKIILPLSVYLKNRDALQHRAKNNEIALWIATHETLDPLISAEKDINIFPLIAVFVERFQDGRIFTLGNLLRTRHQFKNTLRAFGDVLQDQLFYLKRSGFDSYLIKEGKDPNEALKALQSFSDPYQGAVDIKEPVWKRKVRS
ncbi:DUF934 domain-containing protein [Candidatus Methylopumilus rimovensis]|uniref:DUF934 domain-containing protein n=2 Tax=Candidatus Methylopumilus rimovensis TaxID=2588535 RepID=A0AAE6FSS5_9PROT|nr:DUF934 domain-containing protein [Candidatus Methylopumilus rimovensis]QDD13534.1 DUF934 domain-containing protein [Candidatus Methylopumilus rimovensis]